IYVGGPGGLWVLDPGGKLLGRILMAARPVNMAWGDKDWKSLYIASNSSVYRLRLEIPGVIVGAPAAD
ncbi:MAG: SMP-30/gluconolactonase/LRE family protein, partial [Chloroflexi bacterium]|nr:SMP-30/gluconolactonase/LRE family protein [Chloroflexota bacterium]